MLTLSPQEYVEAFFGESCETDAAGGDCQLTGTRRTLALQTALDNFRYENELYWKKSILFWAFTALAFTGLFVSDAAMRNPYFYQLVVCSIGAVISFAWVAITKGSRYTQEKWCRLVHTLEDEAVGPLFKTHTMITSAKARANSLYHPSKGVVCDPASPSYELRPFCASKVNDYLSLYLACTWVFLAVRYFVKTAPELASHFLPVFTDPAQELGFISLSFVAFSAYFLVMMFFRCRTSADEVNCADQSHFRVAKFNPEQSR